MDEFIKEVNDAEKYQGKINISLPIIVHQSTSTAPRRGKT